MHFASKKVHLRALMKSPAPGTPVVAVSHFVAATSGQTEEVGMPCRMRSNQAAQFEEWIRVRAQSLWDHEGRPEGRSEEFWLRAEREIEVLWNARFDGETMEFVPPHPRISRRPVRRVADDPHVEVHKLAA